MGSGVEDRVGANDNVGTGAGGRLWVRGGTLVGEHGTWRGDVLILDGKIAAVGDPAAWARLPHLDDVPVLDASGRHVLPGVIDVHVHFRDPGLTHKEDFLTGSAAAACGGVTTVLDMPNTIPPVSTAAALEHKRRAIEGRSYVDYGLYGAITDENAAELEAMAAAGAIAWKLFLGPTTGDIRAPELGALLEIFQAIAPLGLPVVVHAEDRSVIERAEARLRPSGSRDYEDLLASRPRMGELVAVDTAARLAEATGVRVHLAHLALREAVDVVAHHKERGVPVTAETCPPYLFLSREDAPRFGPEFKILPPVRDREDGEALWRGLQDGTVDVVATDHAPHLPEEKEGAADIWSVPGGSRGVETLLPLMLDAVAAGRLSLPRLVAVLCANPARIFGLYPAKGTLRPGADGDLVVVDLERETAIDEARLHSKGKRSLFHGRRIRGAIEATVLRGRPVAVEGELVGEPGGRLLRPAR